VVTFAVTSGEATFNAPQLGAVAKLLGDRGFARAAAAASAPTSVMVSTDDNGFAFAPGLTAGQQAGQVQVTASTDDGPPTAEATYTLQVLSLGGAAPTARREVQAAICTSPSPGGGQGPSCTGSTLRGTFPPLAVRTRATLVRRSVTHAVGHAAARYGYLALRRSRPIPAGRYRLILGRGHHTTTVPVTLR
jgi:hypothetical protein